MSSDAEETYLREQLALIQREYQKAAKPYIDRLVKIACMKPPPPIIVSFSSLSPELQESLRLAAQEGTSCTPTSPS